MSPRHRPSFFHDYYRAEGPKSFQGPGSPRCSFWRGRIASCQTLLQRVQTRSFRGWVGTTARACMRPTPTPAPRAGSCPFSTSTHDLWESQTDSRIHIILPVTAGTHRLKTLGTLAPWSQLTPLPLHLLSFTPRASWSVQ